MNKTFYPVIITPEWAKQLLRMFFNLGTPVDYEHMKVMSVSGKYPEYVLSEIPSSGYMYRNQSPDELYIPPIIKHRVKLEQVYDPYNEEVTSIGYCQAMNTLVVGLTYKV